MRSPIVLAVDRDRRDLQLLSEYLSDEGFEFVAATRGDQGLAQIGRRRPDLVLLEVELPWIDGFALCRQIKSNPQNRLLPVVLMGPAGSTTSPEYRIRAADAGADDLLAKPIDRDELTALALSLITSREVTEHYEYDAQLMAVFARVLEARVGGPARTERIAHAARALGIALGLSVDVLYDLYLGGLVHDVGNIVVPDAILLKPGPLTPEETAVVRRHVTVGAALALELHSRSGVAPLVRHHHERFDGHGYPEGLRGSEIPAAAMIVSVCSSYEAMTSLRPYRRAMPPSAAIQELRRGSGSQFDPEVVTAFVEGLTQRRLSRGDNRSPGER